MNRLKVLVIGISLTDKDKNLVIDSLDFFKNQIDPNGDIELGEVIFEDIVAKPSSCELAFAKSKYGYMLVLGTEALNKLDGDIDNLIIQCFTVLPSEWGKIRDRVTEQLKKFVKSWVNGETEQKLLKLKEITEHKVEWIIQNINQFKSHVQLMIQNKRPYAVYFKSTKDNHHCILTDATKRLRKPINEIVPIVVDSMDSRAQEKIQKNLQANGYNKIFFLEIEEFMSHIICMSKMLNGESVNIKVEPNA